MKNLASQTAGATEDIESHVGSIQNATHNAVGAIREITTTVSTINEIAASMKDAVTQQRDASGEISARLAAAASDSGEVAASVEDVARGARDTRDAAAQMYEASEELSRLAETLRSAVGDFLDAIRGAA